ncbi:MAG: rod shape-determining protein RodA [Draconibacterium sp.]|nr:MAG: rod shape-determining protein RodA [Draconibacterium sp.]
MNNTIVNIFRGDKVIWIVLFFLSALSLLIVYSSTGALAYREAGGNTLYYLTRQVVFIAVGIGVMLFMVHILPVKIYALLAPLLVYTAITLLFIAVVSKFTGRSAGSGRTLDLGIIAFQPAEFAKIALIMFSAKVLGKKQKTKGDLFKAFKSIIIHTVIICGMIFIFDFSTSALLFATVMTMMFTGRIPLKYLGSVVGVAVLLLATIYFSADYVDSNNKLRLKTIKGRIDRFISDDGPGHSDVSNFMAAAYNDFIFAIIVEEYGLVTAVFVIFLYLVFFFRSIVVVRRATRTFPAFLVIGLTLMLVFQAMVNAGVSSGVLPVTGQPLPWISLGGTSLLFTSVAFGCILSVSYQNQENKTIQEPPPVQVTTVYEDYELQEE